MADRDFDSVKRAADGRTASAYRIACAKCSTEILFHQHGDRRKSSVAVASHFRNRGWAVGSRPRLDRCPDCRPTSISTAGTAMTKTAVATIEPPKEMTREDRRIIFAQLNEIYIGEDKGYSAGWTDQRVATHLGVPRAWVATIRDENFGPVRDNETSTALRGEIDNLSARMTLVEKARLMMEEDFAKGIASLVEEKRQVLAALDLLRVKIARAL